MKMYDVLDFKTEKKSGRVIKVKIKNDSGKKMWYDANKFTLFAEAAALMAAGAGHATPNGEKMMRKIDAAAGFTAREGLEIGKAIADGIAAGSGLAPNITIVNEVKISMENIPTLSELKKQAKAKKEYARNAKIFDGRAGC